MTHQTGCQTNPPKVHDPAKTLILNKSNFALPYMALFNISRIRLCDIRSIQLGNASRSLCLRMRLNSRARICASAISGDISTRYSTKVRSSASNFSASRRSNQLASRAEATIFLALFSGAGEFGPVRARFSPSGNAALHRATKATAMPGITGAARSSWQAQRKR